MLRLLFLVSFFLVSIVLFSQEKAEFKPNGKPIVKVFANYHTDFGNTAITRINRAYLGYKYNLSPNYNINLTLDVLNLTGFYEAYLKNAYLKYHKEKFYYTLGIISTIQYKVQEKIWGYRYIQKVFSDKYGLNSGADIGVSAGYDINDKILVDVIVQNGTGYKKIYATKTYRGGIGITYKPIKPLTFRFYYDISHKPKYAKQDYVGFVSYKFKDLFLIAGEYDYQTGFDYIKGQNYGGFSFFARYFLNDKFEFFAKYDNVNSSYSEGESENHWFKVVSYVGDYFIGGVQYKAVKGVKFSINYQAYNLNYTEEDKSVSMIYFNVEFKIP